jgi:plasmid stability protein
VNIRNIDTALLREIKVRAAMEGITLRAWVIRALEQAVGTLPDGPIDYIKGTGTVKVPWEPIEDLPAIKPAKTCKHGFINCGQCNR